MRGSVSLDGSMSRAIYILLTLYCRGIFHVKFTESSVEEIVVSHVSLTGMLNIKGHVNSGLRSKNPASIEKLEYIRGGNIAIVPAYTFPVSMKCMWCSR